MQLFLRTASSFCWGFRAGASHPSGRPGAWERSEQPRGAAVALAERDFYFSVPFDSLYLPLPSQPLRGLAKENGFYRPCSCSLISCALLSVNIMPSAFHLPEIYQICRLLRPRIVRKTHVFPLPSRTGSSSKHLQPHHKPFPN